MHYRDAFAAIDWLCDVLGFTRHLVVPDGKGGVAHAELTLGNGMIMLGSHRDEAGDSVVAPIAAEYWTQSTYIVVGDIEASYERAKFCAGRHRFRTREQHYGGSLFFSPRPQRTTLEYRLPTTPGQSRESG
ncbi:hypothetical protein GBAR_LOCUS23430 [Geodia barretti]|uniref:Glyoxalase/fosfomycin resistance/dioxygenase domain-containing protein n=1 Tax=Geodia barretti TaxID=519541 RepID=A0AA35X789_GEOBA|nr:hypothetical protein GBAR_LOCUS23430 [Geodia barretti]